MLGARERTGLRSMGDYYEDEDEQPVMAPASTTPPPPAEQILAESPPAHRSFDKVRYLERAGRNGVNTIDFAWELRTHPGIDLGLGKSKSEPKVEPPPPRKPRRKKGEKGKTKEELKKEAAAARDAIEIERLEKVKLTILAQRAETQKQMDDHYKEATELGEKIAAVNEQAAAREKEIEELGAENDDLRKDLNHMNDITVQRQVAIANVKKQIAELCALMEDKSKRNKALKYKEMDLDAITFGPTDEVSAQI